MPSWQDFAAAFDLFRDPMLAGLAAGVALGLLSLFIVLRRMVFFSAALSQSAGLGVALAFYLEILLDTHVDPVAGAAALSLITGIIVSGRPELFKATRETFLALVFIGAGALAVLLGDSIAQEAHDIHAILFGTAVLVRHEDFLLLAGLAAVTLGSVVLFWRGLLFTNFDPEGAHVQGLPTKQLNALLFGLIIALDAVATRALGSLPVFAFSTLPAVAALGFTRNLTAAAFIAAALGAAAGLGGYVAAFFLDWPVGATQTMVLVAAAAVALLYRRLLP